jgi:hypothetical protein
MTEQQAKREAQERGTESGCAAVAAWLVYMLFLLGLFAGLMNLADVLK